jgi:uncharacterized protein
MDIRMHKMAAMALAGLGMGASLALADLPNKPPETTSKVKKVLLYNKIGGWVHTDGIADVKAVMTKLAAAKKFQLTQIEDESPITLEYLKGFNVIIWNNNTNGASSVPSTNARKAILDYLNGGGGWFLIHGAGDHGDTWTELKQTMGTKFSTHGSQGDGLLVVDSAGRKHKEMKYITGAITANIRLKDEWYAFDNTVRNVSGVTVLATAKGVNGTYDGVVLKDADGIDDRTYIWGREVGKGRFLYNAIGHGQNQLMAQADSAVPKLYWQCMRYAAGDFQNGCTQAGNAKYDSAARVDDGTCTGVGVRNVGAQSDFYVTQGDKRLRINFFHNGDLQVSVRNLRGALVWKGVVNTASNEFRIGESVRPGAYQLEIREGKTVYNTRVVL